MRRYVKCESLQMRALLTSTDVIFQLLTLEQHIITTFRIISLPDLPDNFTSGPFNGPRSTGATDLKGCRQKLKVPGPKNPTPGMNSQFEITLSWFVVFPQILDYSSPARPLGRLSDV